MLYTTGHGAKTAQQLTAALRQHDITLLVDVRSFPGSRRNPDVAKEAMPDWLAAAGIAYRHEPDLGGRRKPPTKPVQPVVGKPVVRQLRGAYPHAHGFQAAYQRLLRDADTCNVAVMCGEPTCWRCHRRMVADLATRDGHQVQHIMPDGSLSPHRVSDWLTSNLPDQS